jgi:hypothetical protein
MQIARAAPAFRHRPGIAHCLTVSQSKWLQEPKMKQFVPMTDDMLYRSDCPPGPFVPYRFDLNCYHGLREADPQSDRVAEVIALPANGETSALRPV